MSLFHVYIAEFAHIMAYVLKHEGKDGEGKLIRTEKITRERIVASANGGRFLNDREVSMELTFSEPNSTFTLIPCTRHSGQETDFILSVFSQETIELAPF